MFMLGGLLSTSGKLKNLTALKIQPTVVFKKLDYLKTFFKKTLAIPISIV